jgi:hypothetical protein
MDKEAEWIISDEVTILKSEDNQIRILKTHTSHLWTIIWTEDEYIEVRINCDLYVKGSSWSVSTDHELQNNNISI